MFLNKHNQEDLKETAMKTNKKKKKLKKRKMRFFRISLQRIIERAI